jgi:hypothetical protein
LLDVDLSMAKSDKKQLGLALIDELASNEGLAYVQRESTPTGRLLDIASDSCMLIQQLLSVESSDEPLQNTEPVLTIRCSDSDH